MSDGTRGGDVLRYAFRGDCTRVIVTDALGRQREAPRVWPDGSYTCPFCSAGVQAHEGTEKKPGCPSPGCLAQHGYPFERAREELAKEAAKASEEADRKRRDTWRRETAEKRAAEERVMREQKRAEAVERGACLVCLHASGYRRFVKHRAHCPKEFFK